MTMPHWWQTAVFYQIYPRSFADLGDGGNGPADGIGDLAGLISRLDYLRDLGIDAVWLSPHYPSPMVDCGYDVADYTAVAPEYGQLDDFQRFLDGAHARGIRVILDLVLNHTSDQHAWFRESRRSRHSPQRDWYIWRPARDGGPPNNWASPFGGSAWELDPATGEYYYHYFFKEQPDLNWRNPAVRAAMFDAVRFWLDRGVDGFRLDALGTLFEDPALRDHESPANHSDLVRRTLTTNDEAEREAAYAEGRRLFERQVDMPEVHAVMRELRAVVDEYDERVLVGETEEIAYHGQANDELHLVFNFPLMRTPRLTPAWVRANQAARLAALPEQAWPCNTLGNHDSPRVFSRYGDGQHDDALARLAAALVLTLPGTPFLYNGEEIGMTDLALASIDQFRDTLGTWVYRMEREQYGLPPERALADANRHGRDKCRTPMQWSNAPHGGFCPAEAAPWLPVNPNYAAGVNVAGQADDPASLLSFYQRLLRARRETAALQLGRYTPLHTRATSYLAFTRGTTKGGLAGVDGGARQTCLVVLNYSARSRRLRFDLGAARARCVFSTHRHTGQVDDLSALPLGPFEVYVGELI